MRNNTKHAIEQKIEFACYCLLNYPHRTQWHHAFAKKFGLKWRQADNYIRLARERLLEATKRDKEEQRAESVSFYQQIARNGLMPLRERIKAQSRVDRLLGLEAPIHHVLQDERQQAAEKVIKVADTDEL